MRDPTQRGSFFLLTHFAGSKILPDQGESSRDVLSEPMCVPVQQTVALERAPTEAQGLEPREVLGSRVLPLLWEGPWRFRKLHQWKPQVGQQSHSQTGLSCLAISGWPGCQVQGSCWLSWLGSAKAPGVASVEGNPEALGPW